MKLIIHQSGGRPIEINTDRVRVMCGQDHFVMREQLERDGSSLLVQLEEHDGTLAIGLALFPSAANVVRLKGTTRG